MFIFYRICNKLRCLLFSATIGRLFGGFGSNVSVLSPVGIEGMRNIYIEDNVYISNNALLAAVPRAASTSCRLKIGKGSSLGRNNHIYATGSIVFGENVLTANNVYVSDNVHKYEDIDVAVKHQEIVQLKHVHIGEGTWLGQNVCVLGANIGKGCVIGSNAVVLKDIPDFSVAVGAPARVVKRYDFASKTWVAVK